MRVLRWRAHVDRNSFVLTTFDRESFHVDSLENEMTGFDENLAVLSCNNV